jgi:hypothetical protein
MAIYQRTENGAMEIVSVKDAMDEVNHAMMDGKRYVREMSSGEGHHSIDYTDGRTVVLIEMEESAPGTEDWASTRTGNIEHRFDSDGRALCNRRLRAYDRPVSQTDQRVRRTRSEIENGEMGHLYTFCPSCTGQ